MHLLLLLFKLFCVLLLFALKSVQELLLLLDKELEALLWVDQFVDLTLRLLLANPFEVLIILEVVLLLALFLLCVIVFGDIVLLPGHVPEHLGVHLLPQGV